LLKRIIAAVAAIVLAVVAAVLVMGYASRADERALADMETVEVLVTKEQIPKGTPAEQLGDLVEFRNVPVQFLVDGAADDLNDLKGLAHSELAGGEQITTADFITEEALRAEGDFDLPEDAKDLHQVTVPLDNPRALGGNIAPGDTVGVFISIEASNADPEDVVERNAEQGSSETDGTGSEEDAADSVSMTHLALHKVLVVRVEGGYVAPPAAGEGSAEEVKGPEDVIHVTLALDAHDAETLVFGMEWGTVWLSLEPEDASEEGTEVVVVTIPNQWRDVYE
jgi:pilus assembly protein CpaB